jgi:hypothetical protein
MNTEHLKYYKFIKQILQTLNIATYGDAVALMGNQLTENILIDHKNFQFNFIVDEYPDKEECEVVIAGYLYKKTLFCDQSYSSGYKLNKKNIKSYLSQKALWDYGY